MCSISGGIYIQPIGSSLIFLLSRYQSTTRHHTFRVELDRYLEALGLQPGASRREVKEAYRRLSKAYHPDISKDPEAKDKFIALTEAYNFLTKVGPTPHRESTSFAYDPDRTEYEAWRKQARARAQQKAQEAERLQQELTLRILKIYHEV